MGQNVKSGAAPEQIDQDNQAFESEMTDFARAVAILNALKAGGKISQDQAYKRLKDLWQRLENEHDRLSNRVA